MPSKDSSLRVLVADDMPLNLRIATRLLRELGHSGVLVNDGEKVLQAMQCQRFDLVLLDVTMPILDGVGALQEIRAREHAGQPRTPVLMVTAHDLPEDRERYRQAGADGVIPKPIALSALAQEIRRVMRP